MSRLGWFKLQNTRNLGIIFELLTTGRVPHAGIILKVPFLHMIVTRQYMITCLLGFHGHLISLFLKVTLVL